MHLFISFLVKLPFFNLLSRFDVNRSSLSFSFDVTCSITMAAAAAANSTILSSDCLIDLLITLSICDRQPQKYTIDLFQKS